MIQVVKEINQYLDNSHELKKYLFEKQEDNERDEINLLFNNLDFAYPCYEFVQLLQKYHCSFIGTYKDKVLVSFR